MRRDQELTVEEAAAAIRSAAKNGRISVILGANRVTDTDAATAIELLDHAKRIVFTCGPFNYDLAVMSFGEIEYYDVPNPGKE